MGRPRGADMMQRALLKTATQERLDALIDLLCRRAKSTGFTKNKNAMVTSVLQPFSALKKKNCVLTLNCHNYNVKRITLTSRAQQDYQELRYEQRGPLAVAGPPNSVRGIAAATGVPE